ncbi:MAG: hypothetical protein M1819_004836 [Sarea resinae]|nr:MAG: hypothetical protein M1819_004836 [Sarea resinae]
MTPSPQLEHFARALSGILGWLYFLAWSLSFYPQPLHNYQRRSTAGFAIDFVTINNVGFAALLTSTSLFLFSPVIRAQYAARHPLAPEPTVRANDEAYAAHALMLTLLVYTQFYPRVWGWGGRQPMPRIGDGKAVAGSDHGERTSAVSGAVWGEGDSGGDGAEAEVLMETEIVQRASPIILGACWGSGVGVLLVVLGVWAWGERGADADVVNGWAWIDAAYAISYVKLVATLLKYIPQAYTNYKLQSTAGWSILQIQLDLFGGVLSLVQLALDSSLQGDWSGVTGNPVKFGLGNTSVFFDLVFCVQHYVLYRHRDGKVGRKAGGSGLDDDDDDDDDDVEAEAEAEAQAEAGERTRLLV